MTTNMKKFVCFSISVLAILDACKPFPKTSKVYLEQQKDLLIQTDREFSLLSMQKGMKVAFKQYIDSTTILLRPDHLPITGREIFDFLNKQNDSTFTMIWEPQNAFVSASADIGYTYGIYSAKLHKRDTILKGTYVSIWQKKKSGKWKLALDSGNEGIQK